MKLLGILLASLAVAGCLPPYIEDLDRAAAMTRQMTLVGTIGPLSSGSSSSGTTIRFLPAKPTAATIDALGVTSGFLVTETADTDSLQFMYMDPSGKAQTTGGQPMGLAGADPNYPLYDFDVTTTTTTANLVVVNLVPTDPTVSKAQLFSVTFPSGPLTLVNSTTLNTTVFAAPLTYALGVQMVPQPAAADVFNFLLWDGGSSFGEGSTGVGGTVFTASSGTARPLLTVPVRRVLYHKNASGTLSYASYFLAGSGWVCNQWTSSTSAVQLTGVKNRIDAVLTSGDLLSTEGGTLRIYDPNGSLVKSVSLGGLQFCYEAFVGPTPYVFFSLSMDLGRGHWAFRAYAVPTSAMRGLQG
jgi:hypothetical protein